MEKLISMTDFVLKQSLLRNDKINDYGSTPISTGNDFDKCLNYANLLKLILELWMFVPAKLVNDKCIVLEEPINYDAYKMGMSEKDFHYNFADCVEYQEAKERVLFEGFEIARSVKSVVIVSNGIPIHFCSETRKVKFEKENYTIEDLFKRNDALGYELVLTESAKKKIGL